MLQDPQPLAEWRRSAHGVTRAWDAWLTAETSDRGGCYRAFVAALAAEESAAVELERSIDPADPGNCIKTIDAHESDSAAR